MSRAIVRRRRRKARKNPVDNISSAIGTSLIFGLAGSAIGAVTHTSDPLPGAIGGGEVGLVFPTLGGLIVALIDKPNRDLGLVTSAVGLGGMLVLGLVGSIAGQTSA